MSDLENQKHHFLPLSKEQAREILISHSKNPRNHKIIQSDFYASARNPICGDEVVVQLSLQTESLDKTVSEVGIQVQACTICTASASLMSEMILRKKITDVKKLAAQFLEQLTNLNFLQTPWPQELQHLGALEHLKINKTRLSCGLLPWICLGNVLQKTES
jgi:nitrogen fixation NifU-like protein